MEERRIPEERSPRTEHRALIQKTVVDEEGVVRRTSIGEDGTIYRTVMYPDGTVKRLKKAATSESIAAAREALAKLEEPLGDQLDANRRMQENSANYTPNAYQSETQKKPEAIEDAIKRIQKENIRPDDDIMAALARKAQSEAPVDDLESEEIQKDIKPAEMEDYSKEPLPEEEEFLEARAQREDESEQIAYRVEEALRQTAEQTAAAEEDYSLEIQMPQQSGRTEKSWEQFSETPEQRIDVINTQRRRPSSDGADNRERAKARSSYEERPRERYYDESKGKKPHKKKKALGVIIMLVVIIIVGAVFWFTVGSKYTPGTETANLNEYFDLTDESQAIIVIDNELMETKGLVKNNSAYIDYDTVQNLINSRIYIDESENILLYSMPTYTIRVEAGATGYDDNGASVEIGREIFVTENEMKYVSLEFIKKFTNIEGTFYDSPNRIVISLSEESVEVATLTKDGEMRELGGTKSPILANYQAGTEFVVLEVGDPWTKVASSDGMIGYVRDRKLSDITTKDMKRDFDSPVYTNITRDFTIHMAWFQSTSTIANDSLGDLVSRTQGLNVIAPTWFFLKDSEGAVASIATAEAVNDAHARGLEVWGVANDFDGEALYGGPNSSDATYYILSNTSRRTHVEEMIIGEALATGLDGINIDYENVNSECGPHYIQFIRELSILCRNNNLVLSVDSYVPSAWTTQYHREEQGEIADYVVIMAYDETGSWSDGMGSNSDLAYVTQAIGTITETVDPSKVIMGLPFYTRIWEEAPMEGTAGTSLSCSTYGMADCASILNANGAEYKWNDECGQYIATYSSGDHNYTVWVEDVESLRLKLNAISAKGLAGWSCWKLGQETTDVWDLLVQY